MSESPRAAARREALIQLGRRVFAGRAYDEVTTPQLAEEGGMSLGLLYRYFGDKRGFYLACLRHAADELLDLLAFDAQFLAGGAGPILARFFDSVAAQPAFFRGVLRGGIGADAEAWGIVQGVRDEIARRIFLAMGDRAGGSAAAPAAHLAVHAWIGVVESATLYWLDGHDVSRADLEALVLRSMPTFLQPASESP
jgi:AcrR family transcriptional regulator